MKKILVHMLIISLLPGIPTKAAENPRLKFESQVQHIESSERKSQQRIGRPASQVRTTESTILEAETSDRENRQLIRDTLTLSRIRTGIDRIYNNEFEGAEEVLVQLQKDYADHPISPLFEGLIYYWKYYPLVPGKPGAEEFEGMMEECWQRGDSLKQENSGNEYMSDNEIEGVFFELVARSFLVMYYADNGKSTKAIPHFTTVYRDIIKGMEMQDEFTEFLFMTGLYNYYREAFPEAYPVYKAPLVFFRRGNKDLGLAQLRTASTDADFLHVEATLFLSLIQINFENNPDSSLHYTNKLHRTYPGNPFFHAKYTEMLLINQEYEQGLYQIEELMHLDSYNRMKGTIYRGIYEEKFRKDAESAKKYYEEGIRMSKPFGERANYTMAYAYIGLYRYYSGNGNKRKAREYHKKARNATGYAYIFD
jgi:hypothetical protein